MPLLELKNVSKSYRNHFWNKQVPAVTDLTFSISEKSITGFIGPNGAGKTTSIKILLGLIRPDKGYSFIRGVPSQNPLSRNKVAYVSEQPCFYTHLTTIESLTFLYTLNKFPKEKLHSEIERVLAAVKLTGTENKKINAMSKGMQQRLNMAQALLGDPDIFIFDEPMSGLDPLGRRLFRTVFRQLAKEGKCIFFSTHILEDVEQLCDNVVVLSRGSISYAGGVKDLLDKYNSGTELIVPKLSHELMETLETKGCTITEHDSAHHALFVPIDNDINECQDFLHNNKVYPTAITPRTHSLESILYASEEGGGL